VLSSLLRRVCLVGALSGSSLGCSTETTETAALPRPVLVAVSPSEFASPPACGSSPGSLVRYVATLVDVTGQAGGAGGGGGVGGIGGGSSIGGVGASGGVGGVGVSGGFALPSSALQIEYAPGQFRYEPVPCLQGVSFGWVVSGHLYRADLLGFDRADLEMLEPGLPVVVDATSRAVVNPRWTASCGSDTAVRAEPDLTRTVGHCEPWVEAAR